MATFDLVLLSSSPPTTSNDVRQRSTPPSNQQRVALPAPSPPLLPTNASSMAQLSGALRSGSRAALIPEGAVTGFATAGSLFRSHHFDLTTEDSPPPPAATSRRAKYQEDDQKPTRPRKQPSKAKAKAKAKTDADSIEPKPRKGRTRKVKETNRDGLPAAPTTSSHFPIVEPSITDSAPVECAAPAPKAKPTKPRKPRAVKEPNADNVGENEAGTKTDKAKRSRKSVKTQKGSVVSEHFGNLVQQVGLSCDGKEPLGVASAVQEAPPLQATNNCNENLEVEEAVARRRDWTPVKDTIPEIQDHCNEPSIRVESGLPVQTNSFSSMLTSFAVETLEARDTADGTSKNSKSTTSTRKRRVELVEGPNNQPASRDSSPVKKAPKKKPRTITDLVTGQYAAQEADPISNLEPKAFFESRGNTVKIPLNDVSNRQMGTATNKSTRKPPTSKAAAKKKSSKSQNGSSKPPVPPKMMADKLLSPSSAMSKFKKQDVLFGTSSQLALEESPSTVRQIQQAIRESEHDLIPFSGNLLYAQSPASKGIMSRMQKQDGKRGLWAASARDECGQMLEQQEEIYIPEPDRTQDLPLLMDDTVDDHPDEMHITDTIDVGDDREEIIHISSDLPTPPATVLEERRELAYTDAEEILPNIEGHTPAPIPICDISSDFPDIDDIPLSTQPQRWSPPSSDPPLKGTLISPRRGRGRPPKSHSAFPVSKVPTLNPELRPENDITNPRTPPRPTGRFANIEEILDSEDDEALSPTPPRNSKFIKSPPLALVPLSLPGHEPAAEKENVDDTVIPVSMVPIVHLQWNAIKTSVFKQMTSTIRALRPSMNPLEPSWYERILMYDPIIAEDLTEYFNTSTSIRVWRRATQKQIKSFNKQRKLQKEKPLVVENEEDHALAVEKELEPWMVQRWCQEMSICCINREGKGRGGARKSHF
ncbi:hypothetical protein BU24DRAFT_427682 [Aaosphaeria arxii CBS 175.79]|uniref:Structure-specific endonuclease subunit SLX4 n=1 Tax=Aaosphaeria arxii CBS 175.79 TaxID=1450172 RepID=A0A6A5XC41_9PLEO|nr:uncharacterized protein BU24DRAFT_427682 [Aaosphaeria arxii CBS 175.79]KAF2010562.1 hypothetical protein BU24DRAFT_427682 [Aaosphaeria arxii CBS 175.79]